MLEKIAGTIVGESKVKETVIGVVVEASAVEKVGHLEVAMAMMVEISILVCHGSQSKDVV